MSIKWLITMIKLVGMNVPRAQSVGYKIVFIYKKPGLSRAMPDVRGEGWGWGWGWRRGLNLTHQKVRR